MKSLNFVFDCLDGKYEFNAHIDDIVTFSIESSISQLESKEGELSKEDTKKFLEEMSLSTIEKWDRYYDKNDNSIEDGVKWYVSYTDDDKQYLSQGEESYEPYNYEHLIKAIMLCDEKAEYFLI